MNLMTGGMTTCQIAWVDDMTSKSQQKRIDVQAGITENFKESWCIKRRIECPRYAAHEAQFLTVKEYVAYLENHLDIKLGRVISY